jgi:hypothetical protein
LSKLGDAPKTQALAHAEKAFRALLQATSLSEDLYRQHVHLRRSYGSNNAFLGWDDPPFQAAIEVLQETSPRLSKRTIGTALTESMIRLFEEHAIKEDASSGTALVIDTIVPSLPSAAIAQEVRNILDYLQSRVDSYTVFVPLEGIELLSSEIRVGDSTLYAHDQGPLPPLLQERRHQNAWKQIAEYCGPLLRAAGSYVAIDEEGDDEVATAHALQHAQDLVEILNIYVASALDRDRSVQKIAVVGQIGVLGEQIVLLARSPVEGEGRAALGFKARKPPLRGHRIARANLEEWKAHGLDQVVRSFTYEGNEPLAIEPRLRRSVRWYSKGVGADSTDEQYVALAIAMESLLIGSDGIDPKVSWGSITQRLAERVAFLLGHSYAQRIDIASNVKRLYRLRSRVIHQGETVSRQNLASMDHVVRSTILAFANYGFRSWHDFLEWERRHKYS